MSPVVRHLRHSSSFRLALVITATALLLAACGDTTAPSIDPKVLVGTFQGWVSGEADIEAVTYGPEGMMVLASGKVSSQGRFNFTLPETLGAEQLDLISAALQECPNLSNSAPEVRGNILSGLEVVREESYRRFVFQATSSDWYENPYTGVVVGRVYVDRDVVISGDCDIPFLRMAVSFDLTLRTGWNIVIVRVVESTQNLQRFEVKTGPVPANVDWYLLPTPPPPVVPPSIDSFEANPDSGAAPLTVEFSWHVTYFGENRLRCTLEPGDDTIYIFEDCLGGPHAHTYSTPGEYNAVFSAYHQIHGGSDGTSQGWLIEVTDPLE